MEEGREGREVGGGREVRRIKGREVGEVGGEREMKEGEVP